MKHEEARNYACPQTLAGGTPAPCIGMKCAAWRWAEPKWGSADQRRGYCGMAGEQKFPLNPENEHQG
ncbi:MAG: hypothetical protein LIP28_04330 [Deltaproteobacteria bacterium]|nr:hypothetical protein [Deltaproteobacteria bacterium]